MEIHSSASRFPLVAPGEGGGVGEVAVHVETPEHFEWPRRRDRVTRILTIDMTTIAPYYASLLAQ